MDGRVAQLMLAQGGAASRRQLLATGASAKTVDHLIRRKELMSVRRDALVLASALEGASPWERSALTARAVGHSLAFATANNPSFGSDHASHGNHTLSQGVHALSHESALMLHGLPYFGEDGAVHLCRTDDVRGRRGQAIFVHQPIDEKWVVVVEGIRVVAPVLAALQVGATHGVEAGLVGLDGVLREAETQDLAATGGRHGPARSEALRQMELALIEVFPRAQGAVRQVVELADGLSESAGESRSRWLMHTLGFGPLESQFTVLDAGRFVARADLKLRRWMVLVEFDGQLKYADPDDLFAEKRREDALRSLGYEVVRLTWADLARPELVRRKILAAIARAEARAA